MKPVTSSENLDNEAPQLAQAGRLAPSLFESVTQAAGGAVSTLIRAPWSWLREGAIHPLPLAQERGAPKVSVIIPCFDAQVHLSDAITSLRRQSCRNWEAWIIDDGSTDATGQVGESWQARDSRVHLLRQSNQGVAAARNRGLAQARGDWVLFLDSDDWLAAHALRRLLKHVERHPGADVVVGAILSVLPDGRRAKYRTLDLSAPFDALSKEGNLPIHSALVRRELLLEAGGFDAALRTNEDWDLWLRLARSGARFVQSRNTLVGFYRKRPGSLSRQTYQVAADGLDVMRRGHRPDPRVRRPAPAHAAGATDPGLPHREVHFALWNAARRIALGGDEAPPRDILAEGQGIHYEPTGLGELLADGMADAAASDPTALAARWPEFEPKLRVLLAWATPGNAPRLAEVALAVTKAKLNGGRKDQGDVLQLDWGGRLGRRARGPAVLQLRRGERTIGAVAITRNARADDAAFADCILAQVARLPLGQALQGARPWGAISFWYAAARRAAIMAPRLFATSEYSVSESAGTALRAILRAGLRAYVASLLPVSRLTVQPRRRARRSPPVPRAPPLAMALPMRLPILMYHRVAADGPAALARYRVRPDLFAEQVRWLADHGFNSVSSEMLAAALKGEGRLPPHPVMITFDDGYLDFQETAWPLLRSYGLGATVFVVPGKVGGASDWDAAYGSPAPLLDWPAIRNLQSEGVDFQSHSFSHRWLTSLSQDELYAEALDSAAAMEARLGRRPIGFCYPYGAQDPVVQRVAEECGFQFAVLASGGICRSAFNPMALPRIEVTETDDLASFFDPLLSGRPYATGGEPATPSV